MARSYGQGFRAGYKDGAQFDMPTIRGGAGCSLGDTVNLGNAYGSLRKSSTRFDELAATSVANRALSVQLLLRRSSDGTCHWPQHFG